METDPNTPRSTYVDGNGHQILNPLNFPKAIKSYIELEIEIFTLIARNNYEMILEVGCFDGRYLDWAQKYGKKYLGIDIVASWLKLGEYKAKAHKYITGSYEFLKVNALQIDQVAVKSRLFKSTPRSKIIAILPFNVLGNISNPTKVIQMLQDLGIDYFISSFNTSPEASNARNEYYHNCSFIGLTQSFTELGIEFRSAVEGFSSMAFDENFYFRSSVNRNSNHNLKLFGVIGLACLSLKFISITDLISLLNP